jgi:parallel beta-helix repeat protein
VTKTVAFTLALLACASFQATATEYYVRQSLGDDRHDGLSATTAWRSVAKLSQAMKAGDTAYVGPGLYREEIRVLHDGTPDRRIVFIADTTGQHTSDPPGTVMITGADPVDETSFVPHSVSPVFRSMVHRPPLGVVEMDGPQFRYRKARDTKEHLVDKLSEIDVVAKRPSTFFYDDAARVLYIHSSDGKPPATHEIELAHRNNGISISGRRHVTVIGFTFRHEGDAGISFFRGTSDGIAIGNTSFGNRQGIRVYGATNILVYGNTLFRNENSGVYFAAQSSNGVAIANVAYENTKGIRWSSGSVSGIAADNVLFDNLECGLSIEKADRAVMRGNKLVGNRESQLLVIDVAYTSENNCFDNGPNGRLLADFFYVDRYRTLVEYQRSKHQDLHSREGSCGTLPEKVDVRALHRAMEATPQASR